MTIAHTGPGIRAALEYVQGVYGPNFFPITEGRVKAWSDQLRELDDGELIEGARRACAAAQRGQPPMPADLLTAVRGRWTVEKRRATDCHGNVTPDCPIESFHVLRAHDGSVLRCFDEHLTLVDYATQNHLASAKWVAVHQPHLLPPGALEQMRDAEVRKLQGSRGERSLLGE